jgi:hypothetical protein
MMNPGDGSGRRIFEEWTSILDSILASLLTVLLDGPAVMASVERRLAMRALEGCISAGAKSMSYPTDF